MTEVLSPAEAIQRVLERAPSGSIEPEAIGVDTVELSAAPGRRLARDLHAPGPWPQTDRSAMDGFACATGSAGITAGARFPVVGAALAGHPFDGELAPGQAVRIMTGGVVPAGADAVVRVEDAADGYDGETLEVTVDVDAGANIRREGSEIATGALLLAAGTLIRPAEVGALAVLGRASVEVLRRPRVAILSTGDEVVPIEREPGPHQVRDSNGWALAAQVEAAGGEAIRLGIASDDAADLRSRLADGLSRAAIVLTVGGVSKGTHDLVHGTLHELGVQRVFHGISLKPGKPLFFGATDDGPDPRFVFGLPGNPASTFTTFDLFVRPLLLRLAGERGAPVRAALPLRAHAGGDAVFRQNWRTQAIPARRTVVDGDLVAEVQATRPSGDPFSLCAGDGYVLIDGGAAPGSVDRARFVPYGIEGR